MIGAVVLTLVGFVVLVVRCLFLEASVGRYKKKVARLAQRVAELEGGEVVSGPRTGGRMSEKTNEVTVGAKM